MTNTIWERLSTGDMVNMNEKDYHEIVLNEYNRSRDLQFQINQLNPVTDITTIRTLYEELVSSQLEEGSMISSPSQIDFGSRIKIGKKVFINHSLTAMSIGGITIGDGTFIGPNVSILTDNHDQDDLMKLYCAPVVIGENVWVGAGVTILPGVTIGNGAILASGALVSKHVAENAIVGGIPAKLIRYKE